MASIAEMIGVTTPHELVVGESYKIVEDTSWHGFRRGTIVRATAVSGFGTKALLCTTKDDWRKLGHERGVTAWVSPKEVVTLPSPVVAMTLDDLRSLPAGTRVEDCDGDVMVLNGKGKFTWGDDSQPLRDLEDLDNLVGDYSPWIILNPEILDEVRVEHDLLPIGTRVRILAGIGLSHSIGKEGVIIENANECALPGHPYKVRPDGLWGELYVSKVEVIEPEAEQTADDTPAYEVGEVVYVMRDGDEYEEDGRAFLLAYDLTPGQPAEVLNDGVLHRWPLAIEVQFLSDGKTRYVGPDQIQREDPSPETLYAEPEVVQVEAETVEPAELCGFKVGDKVVLSELGKRRWAGRGGYSDDVLTVEKFEGPFVKCPFPYYPDELAHYTREPQVGDVVTSWDEADALPDGAVILLSYGPTSEKVRMKKDGEWFTFGGYDLPPNTLDGEGNTAQVLALL